MAKAKKTETAAATPAVAPAEAKVVEVKKGAKTKAGKVTKKGKKKAAKKTTKKSSKK